jgi:hypothetical protein
MAVLLGVLLLLPMLRSILGFISFPDRVIGIANAVTQAIFLGAPIIAIYFGAGWNWESKHEPKGTVLYGMPRWARRRIKPIGFILGGLAIQFGIGALAELPVVAHSPAVNFVAGLAQSGVPIWTLGLGALIASVLSDKNMILPIALVLAILDLFLVFTPTGTANQTLSKAPKIFTTVALNVPAVHAVSEAPKPDGARLKAAGYAGPADFAFLSMFFVALFRFRMRTRETLYWVVPTLIGYLALSGLLHNTPLPALVPIGLVIWIANYREFHLSRDEKITTGVVAGLGILLLIWGITRPGPKVAPSPPADAQEFRGPAGSPRPISGGSRSTPALPDQGSTPNPP